MRICSVALILIGVVVSSRVNSQGDLDRYRVNCTAQQRTIVDAALTETKKLASEAALALPPKESGTGQKVTRWFGSENKETTEKVTQIYLEVGALLAFKSIWCPNASFPGDDAGTFAWVPQDATGEMFLEPLFFSAVDKGSDSKGGTILHEAAHLSVKHKIVDTDSDGDGEKDYGVASAEKLASASSPAAVLTADNLQYFAEDILYGIPK